MHHKRAAMSSVYSDLGIMVVGGILEDYSVTNSCEMYNIGEDSWKKVSSLSEPSMNASLSLFN